MAGALFIITLPTACYENPPVAEEADPEGKSTGKSDQSSGVVESNHDLSSEVNKILPENSNENGTDKRIDPVKHQLALSKKLGSNFSASTPAIKDIIDIEGNEIKTPMLRRAVSSSKSAESLNTELLENAGTSNEEIKRSILNLGKKIVTALTPVKEVSPPDAVSTTSKPDTTVPLQTLLTQVLEKVGVDNAVWNAVKNGNFYQVSFSVEAGEQCEDCIQYLNECGFGIRPYTTVSVIPCTLFYKGEEEVEINNEEDTTTVDEMEKGQKSSLGCVTSGNAEDGQKVWNWNKFVASVRSRLMVAQVVESVRANAELTFDFIMLLLVAGMVAAIGLVENSSVVLVASMLISPLMGPILAGTFGIVIQDRQLQKVGVFNELLGLSLCIAVGFLFGLIIGCSSDHYRYSDASKWPTSEMISRGVIESLWVGVLIALPSGAGVALSVLGGNAGSLIGVAISASLLPPAVNAGLFWALAVIKSMSKTEEISADMVTIYSTNGVIEYATLGAVSLCLTLINIACIFVSAVLVLKIKEVAPQSNRDEMKQFWKYDIKVARDYNKTLHGEDAKEMRKELLEELSHISQDLVGEARHGKRRYSFTRLISEGGIHAGSKERMDNCGLNSNQRTWTSGTNIGYRRSLFQPDFFRTSVPGPSEEELENLVYSTLTAGSKYSAFRNLGKSGISVRPSYRKMASLSFPFTNPMRSPTRTAEAHLDTIKENSSSRLNTPSASQLSVRTRFQVTPCAEDRLQQGHGTAPIAKSDD